MIAEIYSKTLLPEKGKTKGFREHAKDFCSGIDFCTIFGALTVQSAFIIIIIVIILFCLVQDFIKLKFFLY